MSEWEGGKTLKDLNRGYQGGFQEGAYPGRGGCEDGRETKFFGAHWSVLKKGISKGTWWWARYTEFQEGESYTELPREAQGNPTGSSKGGLIGFLKKGRGPPPRGDRPGKGWLEQSGWLKKSPKRDWGKVTWHSSLIGGS